MSFARSVWIVCGKQLNNSKAGFTMVAGSFKNADWLFQGLTIKIQLLTLMLLFRTFVQEYLCATLDTSKWTSHLNTGWYGSIV